VEAISRKSSRRANPSELAPHCRQPNVYPFRYYPVSKGLASYGPYTIDDYARCRLVDCFLEGESLPDLPVQTPDQI
jgi:hypothetical protein